MGRKIKESLKKLVGKSPPEAVNRMGQTAQNIDQGAGKINPHARQLHIMQQAGIGSKAAGSVGRTYDYQRLPRELTSSGQKTQEILNTARRAGVSIDRARRMVATMNGIEERKNQNPSNNSGSRFYSRRESTDISQYSPYLFHSPLLEDFYFTENCIGD